MWRKVLSVVVGEPTPFTTLRLADTSATIRGQAEQHCTHQQRVRSDVYYWH